MFGIPKGYVSYEYLESRRRQKKVGIKSFGVGNVI